MRVPLVLASLLAAGCGLVSGLDSLAIEDGSAPQHETGPDVVADAPVDAGKDIAVSDVAPPLPDAGSDARALTALQSKGGCATGSTTALTLSNAAFTIELWLRLDGALSGNEVDAILWKGGRTTTEPGWSLDVQGSALVFCVADTTTAKCTSSYPLVKGDLVHVAVRSNLSANIPNTRSVTLYARDITAGDATHANVGSVNSAANTWTTNAPLVVGGAEPSGQCATTPAFTIDDLRVYSTQQGVASMDANESIDISCTANGLIADYTFNEGAGVKAADCTSQLDLALGAGQTFIPSPFP